MLLHLRCPLLWRGLDIHHLLHVIIDHGGHLIPFGESWRPIGVAQLGMEDRQEFVTTERSRVPGGLYRWQVRDGVIPLYLGVGRGELLDELPGGRLTRAAF